MMAYMWRLRRDRKGKGIPLVEGYIQGYRNLSFRSGVSTQKGKQMKFMVLKKSRKLRC